MNSRIVLPAIALLLAIVAANAPAAEPLLPTTTRQVVLARAGDGYRWQLTEVPVKAPGGLRVASGAVGEVLAVGREIPIARYQEALQLLESGNFDGKIVLTY